MAEPVQAPIRENDPAEPALQHQIDEIRVALDEWRRKREYSQATEQRLAKITVQCARMVETWQQMEARRSAALTGGDVAALGAMPATLPDTELGEHLRALERTIEHEWEALPEGDDRASLAESCVAAAELTLRGFTRAEARLAALEHDIQGRMEQLSRDVQTVVSELRAARPQALPGAVTAFPLESVMRIHEELREADPAALSAAAPSAAAPPATEPLKAAPPAPASVRALPEASEAAAALAARVESLERAASSAVEVSPPARGWRPLHLVAGVALALAAFALFGFWMQKRVDARLNEAAARVADAERQSEATAAAALQATEATRQEAAKQVADARQSAVQAQIVGNVLAAPDLLRYSLVGVDGDTRARAQVLFSRSRGTVFSASRLPAPAEGRTYQLWLLSRTGPVNAGLLTPDSDGRVTFANDEPIENLARVSGVLVTVEPAGGSTQPSAERVLIRMPTAPAAPAQ